MANTPVSKVTGTVRYDTNTAQLATVDVYDSASQERPTPQNLIIKVVDDASTNLLKRVLGDRKIDSLDDIAFGLTKVIIDGDSDKLKKQIKDLGADYKSALINVGKGALGGVLANMGATDQVISMVNKAIDGKNPIDKDLLKQNFEKAVVFKIGEAVTKIADANYDKVTDLYHMVGGVIGLSEENVNLISNTAKFAVMFNAIKQAHELGANGVTDRIIDELQEEERQEFMNTMLLDGIRNGNVEYVQKALTVLGRVNVLKAAPDIFRLMLLNYIPKTGIDSPTMVNTLFNLFNSIDANWYKRSYFGVMCVNYDLFVGISSQLKKAISQHEGYQKLIIPVPSLGYQSAFTKIYGRV